MTLYSSDILFPEEKLMARRHNVPSATLINFFATNTDCIEGIDGR